MMTQYFFINFILMIFACFFGCAAFWFLLERSKNNVSYLHRFRSKRLNYLTVVHDSIRQYFNEGKTPESIQQILKERYKNGSFPFMSSSISDNDGDIAFVGQVISNKDILFEYIASPNFNQKHYKEICQLLAADTSEKEAKLALRNVLADESLESVNMAMKWLPSLFTRPFVADPDSKIGKMENHYSIFFYLKGSYLKDHLTQDQFLNCLKLLKIVKPGMEFASSNGNYGKYTKSLNHSDSRKKEIIAAISKMIDDANCK